MKPKVWLYSIWYHEAKIAPYFLRNYEWVDHIVIWIDPASRDGTQAILEKHPKVELRAWPHHTGLDDQEFLATANYWPSREGRQVGADWVGFVDADELLWHPNWNELLQTTDTDALRAKGYALISPSGWPEDNGKQIYEQVKTGVHQENENKFLLWRPGFEIHHHHGRHDFPVAFGGRLDGRFRMKNYHCHFLGGVQATQYRNRQNFSRALDKRFAWNFSPEKEKEGIGGTVKWLKGVIDGKQLFDVTEEKI